jgi:hypothetical protein
MHVYVYIYTYAHKTLKPNPLIHINVMCTWIGGLGTKPLPNGFKPHMCFHKLTSLYLQTYGYLNNL